MQSGQPPTTYARLQLWRSWVSLSARETGFNVLKSHPTCGFRSGSLCHIALELMARTKKSTISVEPNRMLVLVGLMGAGKTTIGRRLAARLEIPFIDADDEVERAAGCSIEDMFEVHGEEAFREGEKRVIARLLDGPVGVLATGGGAFMNEETRQSIEKKGVSIWLRADLEVLVRRCMRRDDRPLLKDGNMRETLESLIDQRYPVYAKANIIVDTGDMHHRTVVDQIVDDLKEGGFLMADEANTPH